MTGARYLIVSYFLCALVCLGFGLVVYRVLRRPFAAIADAISAKWHSALLKRALALSLSISAVIGFFGISYTQHGCSTYDSVVKDRSYMTQVNRQQVQGAADWIVYVVFTWGVILVIPLVLVRKRNHSDDRRSTDRPKQNGPISGATMQRGEW